jgi:hypothetical protein
MFSRTAHNPVFVLLLGLVFSAGCAAAPGSAEAAGCPFDSWTVLRNGHFGQTALTIVFGDAAFGVAADTAGRIYYTEDGGTTWTGTIRAGASRAAIEISEGDRRIWYLGVGGDLEQSVDRGRTWRPAGTFPWTRHVEYLSFADADNGWGMTTEQRLLYVTADGGKTWRTLPFPEEMGRPAALHLRTPADAYLLDTSGNLHVTRDGGGSWEVHPIGLEAGRSIPVLNHSAAVRFSDAQHGVIALNTIGGGEAGTRALRTADGGATWTVELLPVPLGMFALSRDGVFLTHMDLYDNGKITLLCSAGH